MHCAICDKEDDNISYDKISGTFSPCGECQAVIDECLSEYDYEEEDEFES